MRVLAWFSFVFSIAVLISEYLLEANLQIVCGIGFLVLMTISLFIHTDRKKLLITIFLGASIGFGWCAAYDRLFLTPATEFVGENISVQAEVCDYPISGDYSDRVAVKISGKGYVKVRANIYLSKGTTNDLKPGDLVTFSANFTLADSINGDSTDYFFSKGIYLIGRNVSDFTVISQNEKSLKYLPKYLYKLVNDKIQEIFPESTKAFALALLLGDKTQLSEDMKTCYDMQRSGIYHIATVSGMHISIIVSFIYLLTGKKKFSSAILLVLLFLFSAMLGFAPSVTRAVIMQLLIILAPFFSREDDKITSLATALLFLLIINPYSATGASLQLTFAATLGIILITPRLNKFFIKVLKPENKNRFVAKLLDAVYTSISACLGAVVFTIPITAIYFGYISIVAPVSAVLILWATTPAFVLSAVAVALGFIHTGTGVITAKIASIFIKYIVFMSGKLASSFMSAVYIDNIFLIAWLVYVYAVIILFVIMKPKLRSLITPVCVAISSFCIIMLVISFIPNSSEGYTLTVLDVGQGQSIVVYNSDYTAVIDCGSSSGEDAGTITAEYIYSLGRNRIDALVLTHYHSDHANGVKKLMAMVDVDAFILPLPENDESTLDEKIIELATDAGSDIIYVTEDTDVTMGDTEMYLYAPMGSESENERGVCILVAEDDFETLITGDVNSTIEKTLVSTEKIPDIECLIVGHHGSKYSTGYELLKAVKPDIAIISVGENDYGHPTEETLERLANQKIPVYRTDELGNITINSVNSLE